MIFELTKSIFKLNFWNFPGIYDYIKTGVCMICNSKITKLLTKCLIPTAKPPSLYLTMLILLLSLLLFSSVCKRCISLCHARLLALCMAFSLVRPSLSLDERIAHMTHKYSGKHVDDTGDCNKVFTL